MSAWTWSYLDAAGAPATDPRLSTSAFPTQSDAESWIGETWRDLVDAGAEAVTLHEDGQVVYGPMRLSIRA